MTQKHDLDHYRLRPFSSRSHPRWGAQVCQTAKNLFDECKTQYGSVMFGDLTFFWCDVHDMFLPLIFLVHFSSSPLFTALVIRNITSCRKASRRTRNLAQDRRGLGFCPVSAHFRFTWLRPDCFDKFYPGPLLCCHFHTFISAPLLGVFFVSIFLFFPAASNLCLPRAIPLGCVSARLRSQETIYFKVLRRPLVNLQRRMTTASASFCSP